jgi:hypothetical protein
LVYSGLLAADFWLNIPGNLAAVMSLNFDYFSPYIREPHHSLRSRSHLRELDYSNVSQWCSRIFTFQ